jgi:hypothetical protein
MSRRIVTKTFQGMDASQNVDGYFDRLIKYIPSDVVGLWLVGTSLIDTGATGDARGPALIAYFIACWVIAGTWTYLQTRKPGEEAAKTQIAIATVAFGVWVLTLQGRDVHYVLTSYKPVYGSLLLILYTTVVAKVVPAE